MKYFQRNNTVVVPLKEGMTINDIEVVSKEEMKKKQAFFEKQTNRLRAEDINFVFINTEKLRTVLKKLTQQQWGYYLLLLLKVQYKDSDKRMYIGTKRKLFKTDDIAELWGVKVDTADRILKKMMKNHLLFKDWENKSYYFVESIITKGGITSKKAVSVNVKVHLNSLVTLNTLLKKDQKAEQIATLGMVVLLLIFIEQDTQFLLKQSTGGLQEEGESVESLMAELPDCALQYLEWKDIQQLKVVKDVKTIKKYLQLLLQYGVIVKDGFTNGYVFNPLLADYRDTGDFELKSFWLKEYPVFQKLEGKSSVKSTEIRGIRPKVRRKLM